jgi:hypothetical protein
LSVRGKRRKPLHDRFELIGVFDEIDHNRRRGYDQYPISQGFLGGLERKPARKDKLTLARSDRPDTMPL